MTIKQQRLIENLKDPTIHSGAEAARRAGYKKGAQAAYELKTRSKYAKQIDSLTGTALDTLDDIMKNGKVEVAKASAAKTALETGLGKPKSLDEKFVQLPPINLIFNKVD